MYSVLSIAEYIIDYCNENGISVSNLKLQKILYFIQAEFLVGAGKPCFPEEIEAWGFGPVVPMVYQKYKAYGSSNIHNVRKAKIRWMSENDKDMVDYIIGECASVPASRLVEITHHQRPWTEVYVPYYNNIINKDIIKGYFAQDEEHTNGTKQ